MFIETDKHQYLSIKNSNKNYIHSTMYLFKN